MHLLIKKSTTKRKPARTLLKKPKHSNKTDASLQPQGIPETANIGAGLQRIKLLQPQEGNRLKARDVLLYSIRSIAYNRKQIEYLY